MRRREARVHRQPTTLGFPRSALAQTASSGDGTASLSSGAGGGGGGGSAGAGAGAGGGSAGGGGAATGMQCGLCALVAGLFRRAMCIAGSRRGSGESTCYQELPQPTGTPQQQQQQLQECQRRTSEIMMDHNTEQNALIHRITEEANALVAKASTGGEDGEEEGEECKGLDELERLLLAKFDVSQYRPKHTGRFLTMHKRRRKRLLTRSLDQEPSLLDDVTHGQVQCVLQRVTDWKFNAFTLETATGGRSLAVLCVHLFHWYGLLEHFNLDVVRVWKLFTLIEEGYHSTNPYHNSIHAADVTQAMHCFLQERQIRQHLSYLEIMASLIAAVTHDLDHPGVNQPFLVATSNHLAALYENTSVLENHHWRSAVGCLLESGVAEQLPDRVKPELQQHISSLILATDITRQQEFLTRFKTYLDNRELDMQRPEHRHFILQIALKCADISNPCRPWDISRKWSYKVCEEFFRQGDYERQLNLPVTALCDRHTTSIPKIQAGFFQYVVMPLYEEWHRFLDDDFSRSLMRHLRYNQRQWESLIREEEAQETMTTSATRTQVTSELIIETIDASECTEEDSGSVELPVPSPGLMPPPGHEGRRHSVPLGVTRSLSLAPRPTTARRESLPGGVSLAPSRISSRGSLHRSELSPGGTLVTTSSGSPALTERPVSAENLLPDTSIASIANSLEASKLSSLVQQQPWEEQLVEEQEQQSAQRQTTLTRQQTFPPVQIYTRMRYMSTTVEMSQCCTEEVLLEADSSSSRSGSPAPQVGEQRVQQHQQQSLTTSTSAGGELRRHSTPAQSKQSRSGAGRRFTTIPLTQEEDSLQAQQNAKVFFIGSPPDSPPRHTSATPSSDSGSGSVTGSGEPRRSSDTVSLPGNKRDYVDYGREKSSKMLKLMKENVDPRAAGEELVAKGSHSLASRRSSNQQSWARRGSAPVGLLARLDDTSLTNRTIEFYSRRGSVPADITGHPNGGVNRLALGVRTEKMSSNNRRRSSLPHEAAIGNLLGNLIQDVDDRENYPLNNNNNNNNNTNSNNNGLGRLSGHESGLSSRRGSVPCDLLGRAGVPGAAKSRGTRSKKMLRRRSSGGPEMFTSGNGDGNDNNGGGGWPRMRRGDLAKRESSHVDGMPLLAKRRGSLPIDMLALSLTGRYIHR